jgi:hypothetical protein
MVAKRMEALDKIIELDRQGPKILALPDLFMFDENGVPCPLRSAPVALRDSQF